MCVQLCVCSCVSEVLSFFFSLKMVAFTHHSASCFLFFFFYWFIFILLFIFLRTSFFFFFFTILNWFCHILTWICHRYTHVPHPEPFSLPVPSLWVDPVHQPQASSIMHWTWTGNSFHIWYYTCFNAILPNDPTLSLERCNNNPVYETAKETMMYRTEKFLYNQIYKKYPHRTQ